MGNPVPVMAMVIKKKNNHLGPSVGRVLLIRKAIPPQPTTASRTAKGKNARNGGNFRGFVKDSIMKLLYLNHAGSDLAYRKNQPSVAYSQNKPDL
jgi:hypothetical protein